MARMKTINVGEISLKKVNEATNTRKFWRVQPIGHKRLMVSWGRIGSWIQSKVFTFVDMVDVEDFVERKVASKLRKGYVIA